MSTFPSASRRSKKWQEQVHEHDINAELLVPLHVVAAESVRDSKSRLAVMARIIAL